LILIQVASLTEITNNSNSCNEDPDDIYFPTVPDLISSTLWNDKLPGRGLSGTSVPQAANKPALDEDIYTIDPGKSVANLGNSQGGYSNFFSCWFRHLQQCTDKPIVLEEDESDNTRSEADFSEFHTASTEFDADASNSRQTSLDTMISSAHSIPQGYDVEHIETGANKLGETSASKTKMACADSVSCPLKQKTRNVQRQSPSKFPSLWLLFAHLTNYSAGNLSEIKDSATDSKRDNGVEGDFDDSPLQKKRQADDRQSDKEGKSSFIGKELADLTIL
jgi:hypothetical protein